jgi:hypothetical protein
LGKYKVSIISARARVVVYLIEFLFLVSGIFHFIGLCIYDVFLKIRNNLYLLHIIIVLNFNYFNKLFLIKVSIW